MKTMAEPQICWTVREEKIFAQLRDLAKRYDVGKLVLFGSRARRLQAEKSDVDIAVYDCADFRDFAFDVEEKVDTLLTFDIVNMNESPSAELVAEILRDGVILYEKVQEPLINSASPSWRIFSDLSASANPPHSPAMRPVCLLDRAKNLHQSDELHFISDSYDEFSRHLHVLAQAPLQDLENEFIISGIIDKFFIQFELGWKVLKELLRYEGKATAASGSPREIIKAAYRYFDFLEEDVWLDMLRTRNDLTHIYDSARARALVAEILTRFIPAFETMDAAVREAYPLELSR